MLNRVDVFARVGSWSKAQQLSVNPQCCRCFLYPTLSLRLLLSRLTSTAMSMQPFLPLLSLLHLSFISLHLVRRSSCTFPLSFSSPFSLALSTICHIKNLFMQYCQIKEKRLSKSIIDYLMLSNREMRRTPQKLLLAVALGMCSYCCCCLSASGDDFWLYEFSF